MSLIGPVNGKAPRIAPTAFVAWGAVVLGDVELAAQVNLWYGCVLRGDINWIRVGERTNIQDGSIIHVGHKGPGTLVGADVVIGHRVVLHSCVVEDQALIGMGAVVLDHAKVGKGAVVGAGSVVAPGQVIPPGVLALGVPAQVKRPLTADELARPLRVVNRYLRVAECHQDQGVSYDFSQEA
ncbi:MAG: gamma carbonic anhydrase family protein [Desulfarculus sp.]|nr:gamma carbonic anhydrase family protein [Desulfarculus sp.]